MTKYFNALFGRYECFLIVQEDISLLQNRRFKLRNKVENIFVSFLLSFLNSYVAINDKEDANKLNGVRRDQWS